ncbi:MAG: hypothetical protein J6X02_05565 [Bacilli bacterium]|nr:hypothetical protein [Bacilli bacterium]
MKKFYLMILFIIMSVFVVGCGRISSCTMDGKVLHFNQQYQDYYINYYYPEEFTKVELNEYVSNQKQEYEFYNNNQKAFKLRVEQHSLLLSFTPMNEDAEALEKDVNHKNVEHQTIKVNGKNMVRYSYRMKDEFGDDTLYYVYYGGYSYMGVSEYIKIYFVNAEGQEDFEKAFLSSFKINH